MQTENETGYIKFDRDWTLTLAAIKRLAARHQRPFTYGDLRDEIFRVDGLKLGWGHYAGVLDKMAEHLSRTEPLWPALIVRHDTHEPGTGFWERQPQNADRRYTDAAELLTGPRQQAWLAAQQDWAIARARLEAVPTSIELAAADEAAQVHATWCILDLLVAEREAHLDAEIAWVSARDAGA